MKIWEPKSVLCWDLRMGIMTCVIIRMILMFIGLVLCTADLIIIHIRELGILPLSITLEVAIVGTIISGCLIAEFFCLLLSRGVKKNKPSLYVAFVLWQELEAVVVFCCGLFALSVLASPDTIGFFFLIFIVTGGILVYIQCFVLVIRAYYLEVRYRDELQNDKSDVYLVSLKSYSYIFNEPHKVTKSGKDEKSEQWRKRRIQKMREEEAEVTPPVHTQVALCHHERL